MLLLYFPVFVIIKKYKMTGLNKGLVVFIGRLTAFYVILVPMEHIPIMLQLCLNHVP